MILRTALVAMLYASLSISLLAQSTNEAYDWSMENIEILPDMSTSNAVQEALEASAKNPMQITMSSVGFDIQPKSTAEGYLQKLATACGGNYYHAAAGGQLTQILSDAAAGVAPGTTSSPSTPPVAECRLELKSKTVAPNEPIIVVHSDFPVQDVNAWIGFYAKDADSDKDYLSYTFLKNLSNRTYDVPAPEEPGEEYHFRIFKTGGYDNAVRSEKVKVRQR